MGKSKKTNVKMESSTEEVSSDQLLEIFTQTAKYHQRPIVVVTMGIPGSGKSTVVKKIIEKNLHKIIPSSTKYKFSDFVNCNPDDWEGDYRLFESLSCAPMVLIDKMITPAINPFENRKHLVYYSSLSQLGNELEYYLDNDLERNSIASNGHKYALKYHKTSNRIDEILEVIGK